MPQTIYVSDIQNPVATVVDSNVLATAATLNSPYGSIIFTAGKTGAGILTYVVTNSSIDKNSVVLVSTYNMTTASNFSISIPNGGGSFTVTFGIATVFAANAQINFAIIKSA